MTDGVCRHHSPAGCRRWASFFYGMVMALMRVMWWRFSDRESIARGAPILIVRPADDRVGTIRVVCWQNSIYLYIITRAMVGGVRDGGPSGAPVDPADQPDRFQPSVRTTELRSLTHHREVLCDSYQV